MTGFKVFISFLLVLICSACQADSKKPAQVSNAIAGTKVICMGGGITAGVGLDDEMPYPALIAQYFSDQNIALKVVNAGIKGETVKQANERIDWLLQQRFDIFVLEVGWDDFLKKQDLTEIQLATSNLLEKIMRTNPSATILVLPPPLGPKTSALGKLLSEVITANGLTMVLNPLSLPPAQEDWQQNTPYPTSAGHQKIAHTLSKAISVAEPNEQ